MTKSRALASCPCVVYIVYTPGPHAESSGYEAWLRKVDNPFFNAIPGIRHYANWRIERVAGGQQLDYAYLDFQGLDSTDDLERVWFNPDLDRFRVEWVRLWGYAGAVPLPVQAHAYLMRPIRPARGVPRDFARITGGRGTAPTGTDLAWTVDEVITKHFALAGSGPWRRPAGSDNPLGLDWLTLDYRDGIDDASSVVPPTADIAFAARCMASPEGIA